MTSGDDYRTKTRERWRRWNLKRRLRTDGVDVELPNGWAVATTRTAHRMAAGKPACNARWIEDGSPSPAPLKLCKRCSRAQAEDWSEWS